jgi:NAD(P)-dependent dehydrogenase (short-subunit alcohol dehydrogenase family)
MPSYFITGASRGLGLAFAEKLLANKDNIVVASARNTSAEGLKALAAKGHPGKLHLVTLDVGNYDAYAGAVAETEKVLPNGLDYLIVNAAVDLQTNAAFAHGTTDLKLFEEELKINVVSPVATTRAFTPLLEKGTAKKVLYVTSEMGSITLAGHIPFLSDTYSVGKAGLNMVVRKYGAALKALGSPIILINVYPGWIQSTELGLGLKEYFDKYAPDYPRTTLDEGIDGTLNVLHTATAEQHTKFLDYKGVERPW